MHLNFLNYKSELLCYRKLTLVTKYQLNFIQREYVSVFFLLGFSFTNTDDSQDSRGREETIFYSTLPLPSSAHKHLDIYFATLHMRWLSHISNHTACIYQAAPRWDLPPYRVIICMIGDVILIFVCLLFDLIQGFYYSYLTLETSGQEPATTIILVLQVNWLTKCTSHPLSGFEVAYWKKSLINKNLSISLMRKCNSH